MYLLDTDVLSNLRRPRPHPALLAWIADTEWRSLRVTLATIFEIQYGIERVRAHDSVRAVDIERWLDAVLATGQDLVIQPDIATARLNAGMAATPELANFVVPDPRSRRLRLGTDLTIAATAIVASIPVVSFNIADYVAIGRTFPLPGIIDARTMQPVVPSA